MYQIISNMSKQEIVHIIQLYFNCKYGIALTQFQNWHEQAKMILGYPKYV